jgi:zinc protease
VLANIFAGAVDDQDVILSPAQELALFEEAVRGYGPAEAHAALKEAFQGSGPLIFATNPTPIAGGREALLAAVTESRKLAVAPPVAAETKAWAYSRFGQPGRVVERTEMADLGVTRVRFANGVNLLVRPSSLVKDQVLVNARFGGGRLALPKDLVTWPAMQGGFVAGGLKALTDEERKEALTGKVYDVNLGVADDAFILAGATRPEDLATQMQVLAAYATDAAWREGPFNRMKAQLQNVIPQIETRPFTVAFSQQPRVVRSGDGRWGLPRAAELATAELAPIRAAIEPALARAPVEVVMVGDVTVDQAIAQTAATFGALPARDAKAPRLPGADRLNLAPSSTEPFKLTHSGRPDVGLSLVAWRTDDFYDDLREARVIQMLRAVVETRARDKLREELGATYSPSVQNENSEVFDEFGMLTVAAEVKPDETGRVMQAMEAVAADLIRGGVTEDELNRARQPILSSLAKDRAGNEYWAQQLGGATWDPRRLEKIRTAEAHVNTVTAADIQRAAAAYLRPDRAWRMLVSHSGATNAAAAAPGSRVVMQPGQTLPPGAVIRSPGQGAPAGVIMQGPGQTLPPGAVIQQPGQPAPATVVRPGAPG